MAKGNGGRQVEAEGLRSRLGVWAIVTAFAAGSAVNAPAIAQQNPPTSTQGGPTIRFDIPAEDLNAALLTFANRAGFQLFYDVNVVKGLRSAALNGSFTPQQGLAQLLAGTGMTYRVTGANTVTLEAAPAAATGAMTLGPVRVEGESGPPSTAVLGNLPPPYAGGQVATGGQLGILGNKRVMDTPFNQTSYTSQLMQNQQATILSEVLLNDPSITVATSPQSGIEQFMIRGFDVNVNDVAYGGMYGIVPYSTILTDMAERVEVLKGPSAFLNGMPPGGAVGGTINIVPKHATDAAITDVTPTYASNGQLGGAIDFSRRYGDNGEFGVRFNGVYRDGNTAIDRNSEELGLGVLGLDYRGERLRLSADLGYQVDNNNGLQRPLLVEPGFQIPSAPDPSRDFQRKHPAKAAERWDQAATA
jgi:iron complex outermembrane receptor protein